MHELIGKKLGQYNIQLKIGAGGMAVVFKAYQHSLDRTVAIKVLPPALVTENPDFAKRFRREAKLVARLHHPNILPVYDFGIDQGYSYIVMRYIESGRTLNRIMNGHLEQRRAIELISQIGQGLAHAHTNGIIHRDLKPSNVLMDNGWALLSDFGLAKTQKVASTILTGTGLIMGTIAYMSPEQARGESVDHRSDIYALGIVLYQMLTGVIPHDADTPLAILHKRSTQLPPSPSSINSNISKNIEHILLRTLAQNPEERYDSATDFITDLERGIANKNYYLPTFDKKAPQTPTSSLQRKHNLNGLILVSIIVIIVISVGLVSIIINNTINNSASPPLLAENQPTSVASSFSWKTSTHTPSTFITSKDSTSTPTPTPSNTPTAIQISSSSVLSSATPPPIQTSPTITFTSTITFTPTISSSTPPTVTSPTVTPTASATPILPTLSPTPVPIITPSSTATMPNGTFTLLNPNASSAPLYGMINFEWRWTGSVPPSYGFEVSVWREGEPKKGAHDAILDNQSGFVENIGENTYRLNLDISQAAGVQERYGIYLWTVSLVQISPAYADLGLQAEPSYLYFEKPATSTPIPIPPTGPPPTATPPPPTVIHINATPTPVMIATPTP